MRYVTLYDMQYSLLVECNMQCYIEKKEFKTAVQWLQQAAKVPVNGIDVRI